VTDREWRASPGPILFSSLYDGETYDARAALPGWAQAGFDDAAWTQVDEIPVEASVEPSAIQPARRTLALRPRGISRTSSSLRLDFGQNLVGRLRFEAEGRSGDAIVVRHAEVLELGELCVRPLRTAKATDSFVLHGGQRETCEPQFTFHGFRYAELSGAIDAVDVATLEAVVVHSDLERTGWFECSSPELEQLHENIVWSMRGNFVTLPTDCPQRDERLGWTGDIQVFAPTACFLYDAGGLLASWLADLAAEQAADGAVPNIVPDPQITGVLPDNEPSSAWGDAAVIVPWVLYERLGDVGILERQYESMRRWVDWIESRLSSDGTLERGWQYGDWLDPAAPPSKPWLGMTEPAVVATAYAGFAVNAKTNNPWAMKFVDFVASPAFQAAFAKASGSLPAYPSSTFKVDPGLTLFVKYQRQGKTYPFPDQLWPNPKVQQAHLTGIQDVFSGKGSVQQMLDAMDRAYHAGT